MRVEVETGYPFTGEIAFKVETEEAVDFPLYLRIPGWAEGAEVHIGDEGGVVGAGAFHDIRRVWKGTQTVRLRLPMRTKVNRRYHAPQNWVVEVAFDCADAVVFHGFFDHIEQMLCGAWEIEDGRMGAWDIGTPISHAPILPCSHFVRRVLDEAMENYCSDKDTYPELACEPRRVRWIWLVYLLLYAVAIPWYWPAGYQGPLVAGFPLWVSVSLGATVFLAIWTAWVIHRFWRASGEGMD